MDNYDYLKNDFDPASLKNSQLRKIFVFHDIDFPSSAKKPELVSVFNKEIVPRASDLMAQYCGVVIAKSKGIINADSSSGEKRKSNKGVCDEKNELKSDEATTKLDTVHPSGGKDNGGSTVAQDEKDQEDKALDSEFKRPKNKAHGSERISGDVLSEIKNNARTVKPKSNSKSDTLQRKHLSAEPEHLLLSTNFKKISSDSNSSDVPIVGTLAVPKKKGRKALSKPFVQPTGCNPDALDASEIEHYGPPSGAANSHNADNNDNNSNDNDVDMNTDQVRIDFTKSSAAAVISLSAPPPVLPVSTPSKAPRSQDSDDTPSSSPFSHNNLFQLGSISRGNSNNRSLSASASVMPVTPKTSAAPNKHKRTLPDDFEQMSDDGEIISPPKKRLEVDHDNHIALAKVSKNLMPVFTSEANYSDSDFETPQAKNTYKLASSPLKTSSGLVASSPSRLEDNVSLSSAAKLRQYQYHQEQEGDVPSPDYRTPRNERIERYNSQLEGYNSSPIKQFDDGQKSTLVFSTFSENESTLEADNSEALETSSKNAVFDETATQTVDDEPILVEEPNIPAFSFRWILVQFIKHTVQNLLAFFTFFLIMYLLHFAHWYILEQKQVGWCPENPAATSASVNIEYTNFNYQILGYDIDNLIHDARVYIQPQCLDCPSNAICSGNDKDFDQATCLDGYIKTYPLLSFGGELPWPSFRCEPDLERASKLDELKQFVTEVLRQRKADFICGWRDYQNLWIDGTYPKTKPLETMPVATGSELSATPTPSARRKYIFLDAGISEAELFQTTLNATREKEVSDLHKLWDSVMEQIEQDAEFIITGSNDIGQQPTNNNEIKKETGQTHARVAETSQGSNYDVSQLAIDQSRFATRTRRIESLNTSKASLNCRIKYYIRQQFEAFRFEVSLIATLLITLFTLKIYFKRHQILMHLKNQQIKSESKESLGQLPRYLPSNQLRDLIIGGIKSVNQRKIIWDKLTREIERNVNVRSRQLEVHGDITRVWEWIGINGNICNAGNNNLGLA
ncbi:hypothetical protein NADFUDRAFT_70965 [Nadsonia fulvescens var. elongata DSM 6958]|uniref:Man1/Src1 C-terminal domain-containing protein n=1 Tax=Nadsonia fulvescens var. elongata DSM 6958 TaxID=857566 RepID=A0A1E3PGE7_9ASCO|nr:hypothetical protein NADFUDRAFT_70965 [Nadsonia fulvescens var. elongata DSM 6958]